MAQYDFVDIGVRLVYNAATAFLIIRCVYFPRERKQDYLFTFFVFNFMIFFVCTFLKYILMDIGFAFGLFAIFSILRYRTETIPIREMSYQFLVITLGALNGLSSKGTWHPELILLNLTILVLVMVLDGMFLNRLGVSQSVRYEKINMIQPSRRAELLADLRARTGLDITSLRINRIDFLNDSAEIQVFYRNGRHA